jgi:CBS domain-containing protein
MRIAEILHRKGSTVHTIPSVKAVSVALQKLLELRIGALVVMDRWGRFVGTLSERDIIHGVARYGGKVLVCSVTEVMDHDVITCSPNDRIDRVMSLMTVHRVRYLPVMEGNRLIGIVSIGDLVKHQLEEKELEANVLRDISAVHA